MSDIQAPAYPTTDFASGNGSDLTEDLVGEASVDEVTGLDPDLGADAEADLQTFSADDADPDAEPDDEPDDDGEDDETSSAGAVTSSAANRAAGRAAATKTAVRKALTKYEEVFEAETGVQELAATLLGVKATPFDLTMAVLYADRSVATSLAAIGPLAEQANEDPIDAIVAVVELGRDRIKALWALLIDLGAASASTALPPSEAKAAKLVVSTLTSIEPEVFERLDAVISLLRKTQPRR